MISSMTGFGAADGLVGDARATVEIRTVNHRFFSPNLKLPAAFGRWEGEIRELLRQKIARGHVTLTARIDRDSTAPVIDETRLAHYLTALKALQKKHKLAGRAGPLYAAAIARCNHGAKRRNRAPRRRGAGEAGRESGRQSHGHAQSGRSAALRVSARARGGYRIQAGEDRKTGSCPAQGAARPRKAHGG